MKFKLVESTVLLAEGGDGGQKTYKQFLCYLIALVNPSKQLDAKDYILHHINGNHEDNSDTNLALMSDVDHKRMHKTWWWRHRNEMTIEEFFNKEYRSKSVIISEELDDMLSKFKQGLKAEAAKEKEYNSTAHEPQPV